jgi:hypothetical protein
MGDPNIPILKMAARLPNRREWLPPDDSLLGGWSWVLQRKDASVSIILSTGPSAEATAGVSKDFSPWLHASIARPDRMPDYDDLVMLHRVAWGDFGWAYQVFAPSEAHVNIHPNALHLWGRIDGSQALPNFGALGSI